MEKPININTMEAQQKAEHLLYKFNDISTAIDVAKEIYSEIEDNYKQDGAEIPLHVECFWDEVIDELKAM